MITVYLASTPSPCGYSCDNCDRIGVKEQICDSLTGQCVCKVMPVHVLVIVSLKLPIDGSPANNLIMITLVEVFLEVLFVNTLHTISGMCN